MRDGTTRRGLLGGVAAIASVGGRPAITGKRSGERTRSATARSSEGFDPAVHGFGFRNWSTRDGTYPEHDHETVSEKQVRRFVGRKWRRPAEAVLDVDVVGLPETLLDSIAKQLYVTVNQQSGTNGHCYGMVYTAQQYYENPDEVPLGRATASEFTHPEVPVGNAETAPVGEDIDLFHITQFLDVRSWLGRRGMLHPRWLDYERQLADLTSVVDEYGTAGITVFDAARRRSHQVLVYDYERGGDVTRLFVYDPNYSAAAYARTDVRPAVEIDATGTRPTVRPYGDGYDAFVFNRNDRLVAPGSVDRAAPFAGLDGDRLADELFSLALFLVDSPNVAVTVTGPDGRPLRRNRSPYVDRTKTEYARMRYRYGFSPGRYAVRIVGQSDTEYALRALVSDADGTRLDGRASESITAGEVHRYDADVPASGTGSLERDADGPSWPAKLGAAGIGAGATGVAAGTFAWLRSR